MTDQSGFDLLSFLPYRLNQAAEAASLGFYKVYHDQYGMTRPEWRVMANLGQFGSMTAKEICERAKMHKTKVSRAVFSLEKRRWLIREQDENDRRVEHLALSRNGRATFSRIGEAAKQHDKLLAAKLDSTERRQLIQILGKLEQ